MNLNEKHDENFDLDAKWDAEEALRDIAESMGFESVEEMEEWEKAENDRRSDYYSSVTS